MTDLEHKADRLWSSIIRLNANQKCFFCDRRDESFPPHSAHHMIKRRFKITRWRIQNGIFLCAKHHELAESSTHALENMLAEVMKMGDEVKARKAEQHLDFIEENRNPPGVRYLPAVMQEIVKGLEEIEDHLLN